MAVDEQYFNIFLAEAENVTILPSKTVNRIHLVPWVFTSYQNIYDVMCNIWN